MKLPRSFILTAVALFASLLVGAAFDLRAHATEEWPMPPHPLVDATEAEIADAALRHVNRMYPSEGEPALVVFVRRMTRDDLVAVDLAFGEACADPPPYALVVLHGNFNLRNMRGGIYSGGGERRSRAITYVMDLRAGAPTVMATGDRSRFQSILDHPDVFPAPTTNPATLPVCRPYGQIVPPISVSTPEPTANPYQVFPPLPDDAFQVYPPPNQSYPAPE